MYYITLALAITSVPGASRAVALASETSEPFSTTENTEAAFAGTEAVGERDPERLFNHYT